MNEILATILITLILYILVKVSYNVGSYQTIKYIISHPDFLKRVNETAEEFEGKEKEATK